LQKRLNTPKKTGSIFFAWSANRERGHEGGSGAPLQPCLGLKSRQAKSRGKLLEGDRNLLEEQQQLLGSKIFRSTGRSKILRLEVVVDLILEGICLSLGHGIHQLKDLKDKEEICEFSPQEEGIWPWLATYKLCHCTHCFGSCLMYCTLE